MGVVPDGLHVEEEGREEADEHREELGGQRGLAVAGAAGHERGGEGAERDGDGGEHGGGHDAVAHRLHRQHRVLPRRLLHDVADPDAAVDGVDADDGGLRATADAEEQPEVVPQHHRQAQRHQHVLQLRRRRTPLALPPASRSRRGAS